MTDSDLSTKENSMEQSTRDQASKAAALFLWVVVTVALGYGVVQTSIQAAALFAG
ncbi:MFS transporter small subunit [Nocardiopsis oceani]